MQPRDISHQIVKTVACHTPRRIQIQSAEALHNFRMIRNLKVRHRRFAVFLHLDILAVIPADRHARIDDIRDCHHDPSYFFFQFRFPRLQLSQTRGLLVHLIFNLFRFGLLSLAHQNADLL